MTNQRYTVVLEFDEESGECILPLPDEIISELNWKSGDAIQWIDNKDGSWTLRKKEENNA